jgi:hypothetical protein
MQMPEQEYGLTEIRRGVYARAAPALVMVGRWGLTFQVTPPGGPPFTALIVDQANRMTGTRVRLRLLAACVALGCGVAALVVAILLVRGAPT